MAKNKSKCNKKKSKHLTTPKIDTILHDDMLADARSSAESSAPPVILMKVCRLCETKDGPFLDIFADESVTAKKIEELMPFEVSEKDKLPHKICFRCSAKVEELHEFIQKCIKTQDSLRNAIGKQTPANNSLRNAIGTQNPANKKMRFRWGQSINKTNLSNDDLCDVLIKRAMEEITLNAPIDKVEDVSSPAVQVYSSESASDDDANVSLKQVKQSITKNDEIDTRASSSSKNDTLLDGLEPVTRKTAKPIVTEETPTPPPVAVPKTRKSQRKPVETNPPVEANIPEVIEPVKEPVPEKPKETPPTEPQKPAPPFNIMDHVSTIKVNGVGILFQCKLCNRNFLKKDIVLNHGCAKNNAPPKETSSINAPLPAPPKPPTVKYIKINQDYRKSLSSLIDQTVENLVNAPPTPVNNEPEPKTKSKPKAGPASKVKSKQELPTEPFPPTKPVVPADNIPVGPAVLIPAAPSLNSRYKLVLGPNDTFQLVEDSIAPEQVVEKPIERKPSSRKRKVDGPKQVASKVQGVENLSRPEVIDLDEPNESQKPEPYPVGLFQPVPHHSSVYHQPPASFLTPALKKQSYTIVQTGNPSKLLISTKPQPVVEEPKKKCKKKNEAKNKEPNPVVEAAPPEDAGPFTFVGIDPVNLLRPSYALPTDNIIQESQISTSTPGAKPIVDTPKEKDKYSCNMCEETFSREKKLLTHIQSHFAKMDEEDEERNKSISKRRSRKS